MNDWLQLCTSLYGWTPEQASVIERSDPTGACKSEPINEETRLKISVVIPTLNQGDTIEDTILSILGQRYDNVEIIIIDGGSSDNTESVIKKYTSYISYYESKCDSGQSEAINRGFKMASGEILAWINSDDYYLPDAFQTVNKRFLSDPNILFCVGCGDVISKDNQFLRHIPALPLNQETLLNWMHDRWFMQQCCFWRKSLWVAVGGVDQSLQLLMDYDLWFKFSYHTSGSIIKSNLAAMRYYPNAKTVRQRELSTQELAYVLAKHGAADAVREIVANITKDKNTAKEQLDRINRALPIRILKRINLFPYK